MKKQNRTQIFWVSALVGLFASLMLLAAPVLACSLIPPGWWTNELPEQIDDLPLEGLVMIDAQYLGADGLGVPSSPSSELGEVEIVVTDADDTAVAGDWWYDLSLYRFMWQAQEPLLADTQYVLRLTIDNSQFEEYGYVGYENIDHQVILNTASGPTPPLEAPMFDPNPALWQWEDPHYSCCDTDECWEDTCTGDAQCNQCWVDSKTVLPELAFSFRSPHQGTLRNYIVMHVIRELDGLDTEYRPWNWQGGYVGSQRFDQELDEYCVHLESHSLLTGEVAVGETLCITGSGWEPSEASVVYTVQDSPDFTCVGAVTPIGDPPVTTVNPPGPDFNPPTVTDTDSDNQNQGSSAGDDSACQTASTPVAHWAGLLALMAIVVLRRSGRFVSRTR